MSKGHSSRQGERLVMNELEKFENDRITTPSFRNGERNRDAKPSDRS